MSTLDRKGAHAALVRGTSLDRLEFEQLAHDLVDDLCNVTDSVAKQCVAQTHHYINRRAPSTRRRGASPAPLVPFWRPTRPGRMPYAAVDGDA